MFLTASEAAADNVRVGAAVSVNTFVSSSCNMALAPFHLKWMNVIKFGARCQHKNRISQSLFVLCLDRWMNWAGGMKTESCRKFLDTSQVRL
jgi:hypothetical protein